MRTIRLALLHALLVTLAVSPEARSGVNAPAGVRAGPTTNQILISKDVGDERWAITRNLRDGSVTGSVFTRGEAPRFVYCAQREDRPTEVELECWGSGGCESAPCGQDWAPLGKVVLPWVFFEPDDPDPCADVGGVWLGTNRLTGTFSFQGVDVPFEAVFEGSEVNLGQNGCTLREADGGTGRVEQTTVWLEVASGILPDFPAISENCEDWMAGGDLVGRIEAGGAGLVLHGSFRASTFCRFDETEGMVVIVADQLFVLRRGR